jgi:hypothetical protein
MVVIVDGWSAICRLKKRPEEKRGLLGIGWSGDKNL